MKFLPVPDRYSTPRCNPLREEREVCRPGTSTINTTLSYPDGAQVELKNVHYILCPCANNLTCDNSDGICRDLTINHKDLNHLLDESSKQDD